MKIKDKKDPLARVLEVYAIYWFDEVRYHLVIPYDGYDGFIVVNENNCEVIDSSIDGFILIKSGSGRDMFIHWATEKDALLDRLTDPPDAEAVAELKRRIMDGRNS